MSSASSKRQCLPQDDEMEVDVNPQPTHGFFGDRSIPELHTMILRQLTVLGLLAMANVNTFFRRFLASTSSQRVWDEALRNDSCPSRPTWVNGLTLATFLFLINRTSCQVCGRWRGVTLEPVYLELKWLCPSCTGNALCRKHDLGVQLSTEICNILPHITADDGERRYLRAFALEASRLNDGEAVDAFRVRCGEAMNLADQCRLYMIQAEERRLARATRRRVEAIENKLRVLGYNTNDMNAVNGHHLVQTQGQLTDGDWNYLVFPLLKMIIQKDRMDRMFEARPGDFAMTRRIELLKSVLWGAYDCLYDERRDLPNLQTVCLLPICAELIIQPDHVHVTEHTFNRILGPILRDVRTWAKQQMEQFKRLLIEDHRRILVKASTLGLLDALPPLGTRWYLDVPCHELAIAHYTCSQCDTRYPTARAAIKHLNITRACKKGGPIVTVDKFVFSPSRATILLLALCHLPVTTTTAAKLDALDPFFECLECSEHVGFVGRWRDCLSHHTLIHPLREPRFRRIPNTYPTSESFRNRWSCCRCTDFCTGAARATLEAHLKDIHGIRRPRIPLDFYYCE